MSERHTDPLDILSSLERRNLKKLVPNIFENMSPLLDGIGRKMAEKIREEIDNRVIEQILKERSEQ